MMPMPAELESPTIAREATLRELRSLRGHSQEEVATALGIRQSAVSKLERRTDMYVATLRRLVEALGGRLEITARFPEEDDTTVRLVPFSTPE